ncbi:MAG: AAC(3) family N-acetyltransferase [candidate division WS1 bacterium]|jgi:aminoglycoside 3-N-acetyltransferase|nr:AAC(3) family N-acetyltransferase [candidate division WS1 bacterium]
MLPEAGDKSTEVRCEDVTAGARAAGIVPGDVLMFHSSLSSMGHVTGGPESVIDGLLDAVGPEGTVAVPTLCNWQPGEEALVFSRVDSCMAPSYVGILTETLRLRPSALRSNHPTHSIAAIGARAEELTRDHGAAGLRLGPFGDRAFAVESPWERLRQWNAAYCFIGVTFQVNTMVHYLESLIVERALQRAAPEKREALAEQVVGWMKPGVWPWIKPEDRETHEAMMAEQGIVQYSRIGSATFRCARTEPMVATWLEIVESDPERWLPEDFLEWLREVD